MRALLRVANLIDGVTEKLGSASSYLVIIVIAIGFYNVFVRYTGRFLGLRLSSNVYIELQWYIFSLIFFLGFAFILKHGVNVRVDFLYAKWDERRRAWVDLLGTALFLVPLTLIGIYVTITPVLYSWGRLPDGTFNLAAWELSPDADGLPRAPIKSMIIVAWAMMFLQSLSQIIKYAAIIRGEHQVAEAVAADVQGQNVT